MGSIVILRVPISTTYVNKEKLGSKINNIKKQKKHVVTSNR